MPFTFLCNHEQSVCHVLSSLSLVSSSLASSGSSPGHSCDHRNFHILHMHAHMPLVCTWNFRSNWLNSGLFFILYLSLLCIWLTKEPSHFTEVCIDTRAKHIVTTRSLWPIFSTIWTFLCWYQCDFLIQINSLRFIWTFYLIWDLCYIETKCYLINTSYLPSVK